MADNPYDAVVQALMSTEAMSRFTKTPIKIKNFDKLAMNIAKLTGGKVQRPISEHEAEGSFSPTDNLIRIQLYGQNPSYKDLSNAIHHEDIHALLKDQPTPIPSDSDYSSISNFLGAMFNQPYINVRDAFLRGKRAGNLDQELPAYVGAYNSEQLPSLTPEQASQYVRLIMKNMKPEIASKYQRIVNSYIASQQQ